MPPSTSCNFLDQIIGKIDYKTDVQALFYAFYLFVGLGLEEVALSMCKSKIQPLIPLVHRGRQINHLLLLIHAIPLSISICIPLCIIHLRSQIEKDVPDEYRKKDFVSTLVAWRIVFSVDIGGNNTGCLHAHVVERS